MRHPVNYVSSADTNGLAKRGVAGRAARSARIRRPAAAIAAH
jgi:hypothetical protein